MSDIRDRYQDPGAFRTALTQRLRQLAEQSPWTLAELQRQFAYDRFLQRLNARDDGWVLKGAAALLARIDLAELRQPGYRVWPLADHVADKLAATFATYGRSNRPSTRVKDLIDLVVLAHCAHVSADDAIAAVRAQASRRAIVLPGRFDIPDLNHWSRHYPIEARKVRGLTEQTLGEAVAIVCHFVDPILAGTATGSWDPVTLCWGRLS